jgi:hypothetical protein
MEWRKESGKGREDDIAVEVGQVQFWNILKNLPQPRL